MKYRREIDGLRALAVVPVILFHTQSKLFSGGFLGVDVFFVISGYLITTILIEDIDKKRFNLLKFYERRARRILPALFFIIIISTLFAVVFMSTYDFLSFKNSALATLFFISNIYFWLNTGYFDPSSEETPLLHTWSLAVEEQYYLLFPIFLIITCRFGKNRLLLIIIFLAFVSLMFSEWGWRNKTIANFYISPTRAWELLAGSVAALVFMKSSVHKNNALSLLGLAAIIFSFVMFNNNTPTPSIYTLVPVLGTVTIILFAQKNTIVARLLGLNFFVRVGLVSYSAYLWHQPIIAFQYYILQEINFYFTIIIIAFLSYYSWLLIEQPFRRSNNNRDLIFMLLVFLLLVTALLISNNSKEKKENIKDINFQERQFGEVLLNFGGSCGINFHKNLRCITNSNKLSNIEIVLLGDSHAEHLYPGLSSSLKEFNIISLTTIHAPFLDSLEAYKVIDYIKNLNSKPRLVIFTMHYLGQLRSIPIGSSFEIEVRNIIEKFKSLEVDIMLISDVPRFYNHPRQCLSSLKLRRTDKYCQKSSGTHKLESYQYMKNLENLSKKFNLSLVNLDDEFCSKELCSMLKGDKILFRDKNHLSIEGSFAVSTKISYEVKALLSKHK